MIIWLFTGERLRSQTAERHAQQLIAASYFVLAACEADERGFDVLIVECV